MTITITRQNVCRFERLVSKLFSTGEIPSIVSCTNFGGQFRMTAIGKEKSLAMKIDGPNETASFDMDWSTMKEIATRKTGIVYFDADGRTVFWENNGIPQQKPVTVTGNGGNSLPMIPAKVESISPGILDAIALGTRCVDPDNTRYALGNICLRGGTNQVLSTDGRQAFFQDGYPFPWSDDMLCPVSKIFASKELRESAESVRIGGDKEMLFFEVGNVSFWMKAIDGKFPQMNQFDKNIGHFSWLHIDPSEAAFVAGRLDHLPGKTDEQSPVYLELGNSVTVRGYNRAQRSAVEIKMSKSRAEGKAAKAAVNRQFLKNALELGMTRIGIDPDDTTPLVCYGAGTKFIIMPLEGDEPKSETVTTLQSDNPSAPPLVSPLISTPVKMEEEPPVEVAPKAVRGKQVNVPVPVQTGLEAGDNRSNSISRSEALARADQLFQTLKKATQEARELARQIRGTQKHERELVRREQEVDKKHQRLVEAATLLGKL